MCIYIYIYIYQQINLSIEYNHINKGEHLLADVRAAADRHRAGAREEDEDGPRDKTTYIQT